MGSPYLLSGLLKCGVCGRPYSAQGAKSGQFAYYICGTLFRDGAGTCSARYLNAPRVEEFVVEKIRERILNEETIVALVQPVAEEIDAMAGELAGRLEVVQAELADVRNRLEKLYEAIETSDLTLEVLSPRIMSLRHREEQLEAARDDAETQLEQRRVVLPDTEEIVEYVANFRDFLKDGTIPERKALIRNFVEGIEIKGDEAVLTYTVPMPRDGVTRESASVLDFVQSGPPSLTISRTLSRHRGSALTLVNPAYTSQIDALLQGHRQRDKFQGLDGFVLDADTNAACSIQEQRYDDKITLSMPYRKVKALLVERTRTVVGTAPPGLELQGLQRVPCQPRANDQAPARF